MPPWFSLYESIKYFCKLHSLYQNMIILFLLTVCLFFVIRLLYLLYRVHSYKRSEHLKDRHHPVTVAVIIGSGGHTAEMLRLVQHLNPQRINPRKYIMANSDVSSESKINAMEKIFFQNNPNDYEIIKIPRSRSVGQSYITSVFTTLHATLFSFPVLLQIKPDLILCNGPGTCIPICISAFLLKIIWLLDPKMLFVESICRVKTLSLSGKILLLFADEVLVQWPQLQKYSKRIRFVGRIT